jgi:tetratricopeptide (TPR) repeat protein
VDADEQQWCATERQAAQQADTVSLEKRAASYDGGPSQQQAAEQLAAYRERGNVAYARHDYAAATRWYEKALGVRVEHTGAMHPDHAAATSNLAACALASTPPDPSAALLRLRPLLAAMPSHSKAQIRAGRCCVMLGELRSALAHYEAALRAERDAAAAAAKAAAGTKQQPFRLAYVAPRAESDERLKLMGPDGKTPLSEAAQQAADGRALAARLLSHGERCRSLAAKGRLDEAVYLGRAVARACSHSTCGQLLVVHALESRGKLWEAQQEAEEAEARAPADELVGLALARVYARRGKLDESEVRLRELVRAAPGEGGRPARALRGLRAALERKAEGNEAYRRGEHERAAAAYAEALELDVEGCLRPTLLANRAQARLQGGRPAEALRDVDEACTLDSENAKLLLRRAACHVALRQPRQAYADFEGVLALEPREPTSLAYLEAHPELRYGAAREGSGGDGGDDADAFSGGGPRPEPQIDPYSVLGLPRDADAAAVKAAYRKLALRWHPDRHLDAGEEQQLEAEFEFRRLNAAQRVLSDSVKKRTYDLGGTVPDLAAQRRPVRPADDDLPDLA